MESASRNASAPADSRREFLKRAVYAAPVLLTLPAIPALAQTGSSQTSADCPEGWIPVYDGNGVLVGCDS